MEEADVTSKERGRWISLDTGFVPVEVRALCLDFAWNMKANA
jgi:hypothetical protein